MLKLLKRLFQKEPPKPRGWPWSHREWEGVDIPGYGRIVGWSTTPGRVICYSKERGFVDYDLPDYSKEEQKC